MIINMVEALYRIDVNEARIAEILSGDVANVSGDLARAILDRQMKKAATRIKYKDW